jgi:hypothetical protein
MANVERVREFVSNLPERPYFEQKIAAGWRLVSFDWERDLPAPEAPAPTPIEEVPFGLQVADDCEHLEENASERKALVLMMELIVKDEPLSRISGELNRHGYRTRAGNPWTAGEVFDMLPRLIETGPRIFTDEEYVARKNRQLS